MAERVGFEPTVPFWGTQHFQCCQINHSCTFPLLIFYFTKKLCSCISRRIPQPFGNQIFPYPQTLAMGK